MVFIFNRGRSLKILIWFVFFFFMAVGFISICLIDENYDAIYDYCKKREEKRFRKNIDKQIKELIKKEE